MSQASLPEIPAGPPAAAGAPATAELAPVGNRAQMQVSWTPPNNNGDAIDGYELQVFNGSSLVQTIQIGGGASSQAVVVDTSTTAYTYRIRAENKAGWGAYSDSSAPRRGVIKPSTPSAPQARPGDRVILLTDTYRLSPAQLNGASAAETTYQYNLNKGGGWQSNWDGTTIGGLSNGTAYSVSVRAVATVDGKQYISDGSGGSNSATPYGIPPSPNVSATNNGQSITFSWSPNGNNGAAIDQARISINSGNGWSGWQIVNANGSQNVGNGYSQTHSVRVQVHNAAGWSGNGEASRTTSNPPPPPKPEAWTRMGANPNNGCTGPGGCHYLDIETNAHWAAGDYYISCRNNNSEFGNNGGYKFHIPAGQRVRLPCWSGYPGTKTVVITNGTPGTAEGVYW